MKIYKINTDYINYLRKIDKRVMMAKEEKHVRPYVGVVFEINNNIYFAPLTSVNKNKRIKHRPRIESKGVYYGAINLINMIPVNKTMCKKLLSKIDYKKDLNSKNKEIKQYANMLADETRIINNGNFVQATIKSAKALYKLQKVVKSYNKICCDFSKLEKAAKNYKLINKSN